MNKRYFAGMLILCMTTAFSLAASADEAQYTLKETKVFREGEDAGELPLRFYEETPNIPYIGMNEYSQFMKQQPLEIREEDGLVILESWSGETIQCDVDAGTITVENWNRFFDLPLPLEDVALGWKDTSTRFIRMTDVTYEGEPESVVLDFSRYGIRIYADAEDVYLPVSTMSNMMTDIATNHMLYNGENLYAERMDLAGASPEGYWDSDLLQSMIRGEDRPEDLIHQSYADLCFTFDYFFGHPGVAVLDEALAEKGLDQALTDLGKDGKVIKEGLMSADLKDYIAAMDKLFFVYLADGHTVFMGSPMLAQNETFQSRQSLGSWVNSFFNILDSAPNVNQLLNMMIPQQREQAWGNDTYREYGSTAILRLDSFMPDEEGWAAYYNKGGDLPKDSLGEVLSGLKRASENPDIKNVIFDLSCNSGGSPDVMMAILAVTTRQDQLYGIQKHTGQNLTITFEADTNLDGVYDEKDKEVHYDFNYGVLTTRHAFSCGNLFPIIAQEAGVVLIGERSGGGSCCVQVGCDPQGFTWMMSSAQWQLTDSDGISVEDGCFVELPIEVDSKGFVNTVASLISENGAPSFEKYFDDAQLDWMMNEWFDSEDQTDIAA